MSASEDDRTPVLGGIGVVTRHEEDYTQAPEAMDLMLEAVASAGAVVVVVVELSQVC